MLYEKVCEQITIRYTRESPSGRFCGVLCDGFQGGGINNIIEKAGSTKGGLFHHFPDKQALGYAIVDEIIYPELKKKWFDRLASSIDPIRDIKDLFRRSMKEDIDTGRYRQGCP